MYLKYIYVFSLLIRRINLKYHRIPFRCNMIDVTIFGNRLVNSPLLLRQKKEEKYFLLLEPLEGLG